MSSRDASLAAVKTVAVALGDLASRVVFVGGTVAAFYPLDGGDVRPTVDVDCVVNVATTVEYYEFITELRARGFKECVDEGAPLCRQVCAGIRVDIMPSADTAIGPTNRWYAHALRDAAAHDLGGIRVRAITPTYFIATKLEAFRNRGNGDFLASHDVEDVLTVLGGLASLRDEISAGDTGVAASLRRELAALCANEAFLDALPGHFEGTAEGQARARTTRAWLESLRQG